jgi:hypothetical protein
MTATVERRTRSRSGSADAGFRTEPAIFFGDGAIDMRLFEGFDRVGKGHVIVAGFRQLTLISTIKFLLILAEA